MRHAHITAMKITAKHIFLYVKVDTVMSLKTLPIITTNKRLPDHKLVKSVSKCVILHQIENIFFFSLEYWERLLFNCSAESL